MFNSEITNTESLFPLLVMLDFLKEFETKLGIKITCSQETEPLGTAGPLALARENLVDESGEPFFVLNDDVISEYPLKEKIEFHKSHGGEASTLVTKVRRCWMLVSRVTILEAYGGLCQILVYV